MKKILSNALFLIFFVSTSCKAQNLGSIIDLSNQIKAQVSKEVVDAEEKKKFAFKWLSISSELAKSSFPDAYEFNLKSYKYDGENLHIEILTKLNSDFFRDYIEKFKSISGMDPEKLNDKKSTINQVNNYESEKSKELAALLNIIIINKLRTDNYGIILYDQNKQPLFTRSFSENSLKKILLPYESLISGNWNGENIQIDEIIKISKQDALKIKSINFESKSTIKGERNIGEIGKRWLTSSSVQPMLFSLHSTNPVEAYEVARYELLNEILKIAREADKLIRNNNAQTGKSLTINVMFSLARASIADNAIIYSFASNLTDAVTVGVVGDHASPFEFMTFAAIHEGKQKYNKPPNYVNQSGCDKYIPRDYQYTNASSTLGVNLDSQSNSILNKLGFANNTEILGSPDGKIRVIVGNIETLSSNGGIIRNLGRNQDSKPIVYTKTPKTVVINPEKISVGTSSIRFVGTYDSNSKVELSNRLGGKRVVDAANISVICMESLYSDKDLLNMIFQ